MSPAGDRRIRRAGRSVADRGKLQYCHCHVVYNRYHTDCRAVEPGPAQSEASDKPAELRWLRNKSSPPPMPPYALCGLRGPPSWAWQECNRLLRLGRPWGAVTLSRWCVSGDRGWCSARRGLKPKFYWSTQTMVTAGIFPFKENSHGRARNRTRDLMTSSRRLWPLDHEAGLIYKHK